MLPLDDPRWKTLKGGYRIECNASTILQKLFECGCSDQIFEELWSELYHQGDVDQASYASVPHLIEFSRKSQQLDWNVFSLIAAIELARTSNPEIEEDLCESYFAGMISIPEILGNHPDREWDELLTQSAAACIALARGQRELGHIYHEMSVEADWDWFKSEFGFEPGK